MTGHAESTEPDVCCCCGTTSEETEVDAGYTDLCLFCQPCGFCGRQGTACDDTRGSLCCDPVDYPDRPRRDVDEVLAEIAAGRRAELARAAERDRVTNDLLPHTTKP